MNDLDFQQQFFDHLKTLIPPHKSLVQELSDLLKDIPLFYDFYHPELAAFKFFFWMKSILRQIELYEEMGNFVRQEDSNILYQQVLEMIEHIEQQAETGFKFDMQATRTNRREPSGYSQTSSSWETTLLWLNWTDNGSPTLTTASSIFLVPLTQT